MPACPLSMMTGRGKRRREVLRIVVMVDALGVDAQGVKEKLAMDMERFGDVQVVTVEEVPNLTPGQQMALSGWDPAERTRMR